jgi:phosphoribosylformylglycinamidine cyclo-ligase
MGCPASSFMDYFATAKIEPISASRIVIGAAEACKAHNIVLIGGETAEMPGIYCDYVYDFVGSISGFVDADLIVTGGQITPGNLVIGLKSDGLHTNGYSFVNKLLFEQMGLDIDGMFPWGTSIADELTAPHRCYAEAILPLMHSHHVLGAAHITGGGLQDNLVRVLPEGCRAFIDPSTWDPQPIFTYLQSHGEMETADWRHTFNIGIGMTLVIKPSDMDYVLGYLKDMGEIAYVIGEIRTGERAVEFTA